jgi:oligopeptide transport system substrate-binding protein
MEGSAAGFRRWRVVAVMAVLGPLVTSCGSPTGNLTLSSDQTLHIAAVTQPGTMDPSRQMWDFEALFGRNLFETLVKPRPDLKDVQGAAASSYQVQSDGLAYVFHLRASARWSDGQPVTARDFVYGWKHLLDPRVKAAYASFFNGIVAGAQDYSRIDPTNAAAVNSFLDGLGLLAPDDRTFMVKLQMPAGYFKWIAALWVAAPIRQDVVEKFGSDNWATVPSQIIGNGPFKVSEMVAQDHYTLAPNAYYWGAKPKLSHIVVNFIRNPSESFRRYLAGDLDTVDVPLANANLVQHDPKLGKQIQRYASLNTIWLAMNSRKPPFDNPKVREAVARAIDRQKLITYFGHGQFAAMQTLIPKGMNGYRSDLGAAQTFDPAAARQALKASGVSQAALNDVHYLVPDGSYDRRARAQFIIGQIEDNLGLHWTLEPLPVKTVTRREAAGDFQLSETGWEADYPDEQDWMDPLVNGCEGNYPVCPNDNQFNSLVSQADQTTKESQRQKLYDRAQSIVINNYWFVFLYTIENWVLQQPYVHGIKATALDESYLPGDFFTSEIYITQH